MVLIQILSFLPVKDLIKLQSMGSKIYALAEKELPKRIPRIERLLQTMLETTSIWNIVVLELFDWWINASDYAKGLAELLSLKELVFLDCTFEGNFYFYNKAKVHVLICLRIKQLLNT